MSKSDAEIAREIMYDKDKDKLTEKAPKKFNVQSTPNAVILESGGARHQVPSMLAYNRLFEAHERTSNDLRQSRIDIKKLMETIKKMDMALSVVENELTNKVDRYDND